MWLILMNILLYSRNTRNRGSHGMQGVTAKMATYQQIFHEPNPGKGYRLWSQSDLQHLGIWYPLLRAVIPAVVAALRFDLVVHNKGNNKGNGENEVKFPCIISNWQQNLNRSSGL